MKKKLLILALALSSAVWAGDYEEGMAAYYAGNYAEAVSKFEKATEQGDAKAQYSLGWMYDEGHGVKQNDAEAVRWFTKGAEQGDTDAQQALDNIAKLSKKP